MQTKIIEATQPGDRPFNWGKFMLGRFDVEWDRVSLVDDSPFALSLLKACGWSRDHIWAFDLQTGEAALFSPGGSAAYDLNKHRVWVCVLFEAFLEWLYTQDLSDISALPDIVEIEAPAAIAGYRRPGPPKWVFETVVDEEQITVEDQGVHMIAGGLEALDSPLYARLLSEDESGGHPELRLLVGRRVRLTIEVVD